MLPLSWVVVSGHLWCRLGVGQGGIEYQEAKGRPIRRIRTPSRRGRGTIRKVDCHERNTKSCRQSALVLRSGQFKVVPGATRLTGSAAASLAEPLPREAWRSGFINGTPAAARRLPGLAAMAGDAQPVMKATQVNAAVQGRRVRRSKELEQAGSPLHTGWRVGGGPCGAHGS